MRKLKRLLDRNFEWVIWGMAILFSVCYAIAVLCGADKEAIAIFVIALTLLGMAFVFSIS